MTFFLLYVLPYYKKKFFLRKNHAVMMQYMATLEALLSLLDLWDPKILLPV